MATSKLESGQHLLLYKNASVKKVIEYYQEKLEWNEIILIPVTPVDMDIAVGDYNLQIQVAEVIPPNLPEPTFIAYARRIDNDMDIRLKQLLQNKEMHRDEKVKLLRLTKHKCLQSESKFSIDNEFNFSFGLKWKVLDKAGKYRGFPVYNFCFSQDQLDMVMKELRVRGSFFQWMRHKIENYLAEISNLEFHDPLIEWRDDDKRSKKLKMAEILLAMRELGEFTIKNKKLFQKYCEKIFALGPANWADLEADIRKRKEKWMFLKKLASSK